MPGVQKNTLRHIQSVEERPGFNFCALQISRDVRNAIEHGVSIVLFSNAGVMNRLLTVAILAICTVLRRISPSLA